jgi:hypothetical protein
LKPLLRSLYLSVQPFFSLKSPLRGSDTAPGLWTQLLPDLQLQPNKSSLHSPQTWLSGAFLSKPSIVSITHVEYRHTVPQVCKLLLHSSSRPSRLALSDPPFHAFQQRSSVPGRVEDLGNAKHVTSLKSLEFTVEDSTEIASNVLVRSVLCR